MGLRSESGRTRNYTYTAEGELATAPDLGGNLYTNVYDGVSGMVTNVVGPTGETLGYRYDELDNLVHLRMPDGNWITNTYNFADNQLGSVRLPTGITNTFLYDSAGRMTNRTSTAGEFAAFSYDPEDSVTQVRDNTGTTTNLYDAPAASRASTTRSAPRFATPVIYWIVS